MVTCEVSAQLCVTPESQLYLHYSGARKQFLREIFEKKGVKVKPISAYVGHGY